MSDTKLDRLLEWQAGDTPGPWEVILFPTNRCNQRCSICWQRWAEGEYGKVDTENELSDERLLRLVDECAEAGVREWSIVGGGEPLVRGDLVMALCERIRARDMNGVVHTNGTMFTPERLEQLVTLGWDRVVVSLDGPDAITNDAIRSEDSFERASANLRTLAGLREKHGVDTPASGIAHVITATNYTKLAEMVRFTHELGCSSLGASKLLVQGEQCAAFALTDEQQTELPRYIREAIAVSEDVGLHTNLDTLLPAGERQSTQGIDTQELTGDGRMLESKCFEAWLSVAIIADGRVGPCCVFWAEEAETLHDKTFQEVWNGPYMRKVRDQLRTRQDIPSYCRFCPSHIITRTEELRAELYSAHRNEFSEMPTTARARYLAGRLLGNLRTRGLSGTARRAFEWVKTRRS